MYSTICCGDASQNQLVSSVGEHRSHEKGHRFSLMAGSMKSAQVTFLICPCEAFFI